jgi:hypothetical protein
VNIGSIAAAARCVRSFFYFVNQAMMVPARGALGHQPLNHRCVTQYKSSLSSIATSPIGRSPRTHSSRLFREPKPPCPKGLNEAPKVRRSLNEAPRVRRDGSQGQVRSEASTRPLDHLKKQVSPERAKDTRSSTISLGPSGLKLYLHDPGAALRLPLATLSPRLSSDFRRQSQPKPKTHPTSSDQPALLWYR